MKRIGKSALNRLLIVTMTVVWETQGGEEAMTGRLINCQRLIRRGPRASTLAALTMLAVAV